VVDDIKDATASDARSGESEPGVSERVKERRTDFLTARQLAELLQISESTIHKLRRAGRIPAVLLTDKLIRFNLKDVSRALRPKEGAHERHHPRDDGNEADQEESPQLSFEDLYSNFRE
jgi:excisionase family DNA binding protein